MVISISADAVPLSIDDNSVVRVGNTRVTLDSVITAFLEGATAEEIAQQYPSLDLADVYAVIGYYLHHRSDIDSYFDQRKQSANKVRQQNESRYDPHGVRDRLLKRRSKRKT